MKTENSQKLFSVSITHNSKIRELSDGNRVIVCQTNFLLWVLLFLSYELWKQKIELSKNPIQTGSKLSSLQTISKLVSQDSETQVQYGTRVSKTQVSSGGNLMWKKKFT